MRLTDKILIAVIVLVLGLLGLKGWKESLREEGRQEVRAQVRQQAASDAQRMRDLQRQAELRYVVQREAQDRFQVLTVKEVHEAAAPLAACPVPADLRVRLNAAARCARDPAAAGCADAQVPDAR